MKTIGDAILSINPDAEFKISKSYTDVDAADILFLNGTSTISNSDIKTKLTELQSTYDALDYQRKRETSYPTWQEQMDLIFHKGLDGWKEVIQETKDKYPKS